MTILVSECSIFKSGCSEEESFQIPLVQTTPSQPNVHTIDRTEKVWEIQFLLLVVFCRNSSKKYGKFLGGTDNLHHHCPLAVFLNRDLKSIANGLKSGKLLLTLVKAVLLVSIHKMTLRYQRSTLWRRGGFCVIWNCSKFFNFPAFNFDLL